jgi:NADPH2:quinone reductase
MSTPTKRRVARALRAGGPDVIEVGTEDLVPLKAGEVLVEVAAAGLNHAETLIRSGNYAVRLPFPHAVGREGAGTIVSVGPEVSLPVGTRVCWGAVLGSCATHVIAPAFLLAPMPGGLSFEDGACLAVAGLTAGGLARVWPVENRAAVVWGAAGAVGRMLVGAQVIGIASGRRVEAVRAAGAAYVIDRASEDVQAAVRAHYGRPRGSGGI